MGYETRPGQDVGVYLTDSHDRAQTMVIWYQKRSTCIPDSSMAGKYGGTISPSEKMKMTPRRQKKIS